MGATYLWGRTPTTGHQLTTAWLSNFELWVGLKGMSGDFGDCSFSSAFVIVKTNQQPAISIRFVEAP
jgi:hypothetical protein